MTLLKGVTWQNPRGYDPLVAASTAWESIHPSVKVEWSQFPWYRFEDEVLRSLNAPAYDLVMFDHPWTGTLVAGNSLVAWDTLMPPEYLRDLRGRVVAPSLESYELGEHLWGLPIDASCHSAVYRSDLVSANELPTTWEQIESWAKARYDPPHRYGLVLSVQGVLGHCLFLSMMAGLGTPAYADPRDPYCDRTAAEYVLQLLKRLLTLTPPSSMGWGPWDIFDRFSESDQIAYSPSIFAYVNYFKGSGRPSHLRVSSIPGFDGGPARPILGGVGLGIVTTCQSISEAKSLATFLMDEETQYAIFPAHNGQPGAAKAWKDPIINSRHSDFYYQLSVNMATAYVRPTYVGFHGLELAGGNILQQWWEDRLSLEEALKGLRAR